MRQQKETKKPEKQAITIEDAERMVADAWPAKYQAVLAAVDATLKEIGKRHNVEVVGRVDILPAFLAQPAQGNLPPRP